MICTFITFITIPSLLLHPHVCIDLFLLRVPSLHVCVLLLQARLAFVTEMNSGKQEAVLRKRRRLNRRTFIEFNRIYIYIIMLFFECIFHRLFKSAVAKLLIFIANIGSRERERELKHTYCCYRILIKFHHNNSYFKHVNYLQESIETDKQ